MLLLAAVTLAAGIAGSPPPSSSEGPATVLDLGVVQGDGPVVPLRTVVGDHPTVVAFWASYCAPCRAEVPALNRAVDRWHARGLRVVGVALESNAQRVRAARRTWGMRYEVFRLAPGDDDLVERLFPRGLPVTAFVQRGQIALHEQVVDDAELARRVPLLLGDRTPCHR